MLGTILLLSECQNHKGEQNEITTEPNDHSPETYVKITHPEWTKNAVIYQLIRRNLPKKVLLKSQRGNYHL